MSGKLESKLSDADMQAAREIPRQTNTAIVIVRNGVLVEEKPADIEPA